MTSKKVEDIHMNMLDRLLSESGLECLRSLSVSEESFTLVGEEELEEEYVEEATPEEALEEEEDHPQPEAVPEELPYLFPTPSLRKVMPERIRKVQQQNQIHVLPEEFRTDIDPLQIPKIAITPPQKYIDILAAMLGCEKYKSSLAEYWFLDTLANLLRRAQEDNMHRASQAVLIQWFCEWMKQIQHFDAADRPRMMMRFEDIMLRAAQAIAGDDKLPTPREAHVSYKALEEEEPVAQSTHQPSTSRIPGQSREKVVFAGTQFECSLRDLIQIMHYLFDLFSSDFQYNLVRSIFTFPPDYAQVETPYQIQTPKRLYHPEKTKKKEKSPKKDKDKDKKSTAKGKTKEVLTEEYLALMALKAREQLEIEEREEMEREQWLKKSSILPLNFAAEDSFFDKYWPPPPPVSLPPPPPSPSEGKGKGKGGKGKK